MRVSVLLTTRNGADLLPETLASVLAQQFDGFQLIVVDDASTDATPALLAACTDPRLRVLRSETRLGVAGARNFGFAACRGAYIAAQDHDDLSRPGRLAAEAAYLDSHPDCVLVGSEVLIEEGGKLRPTDHRPGASPGLLRWMLHIDNPFTWSSVMFRADAVRRLGRFMDPAFEPADDFHFYHRLLAVGDLARLDEALAVYRWHAANASHALAGRIEAAAVAVLAEAYQGWLGAEGETAAGLVVRHLANRSPAPDAATFAALGGVLRRLMAAWLDANQPDPATRAAVEAYTARAWWLAARAATRAGSPAALLRWRAWAGRGGFRPGAADVLASLAVGTARALAGGRR